MKHIALILILLAGCDRATQPTVDYFPPFQVEGEWTLYFYRSAWAPEGHIAHLEIDQQQGRAIWGWFQIPIVARETTNTQPFMLAAASLAR